MYIFRVFFYPKLYNVAEKGVFMSCYAVRTAIRTFSSNPPEHVKQLLRAIERGDDAKVLDLIQRQKASRMSSPVQPTQRLSNFSDKFKVLDKYVLKDVCFFLVAAGSSAFIYTQVNSKFGR